MNKYKLNWHPSRGDIRDYRFERSGASFAAEVDYSDVYDRVYDQGDLGSCTANAAAGLISFQRVKQGERAYHACRLQIYYDSRVLEGSANYDSGAYLRDTIRVAYDNGAAREKLWDYDISQFKSKPPAEVYEDAQLYKVKQYEFIDNSNIDNIKGCLNDGYAFMFGFTVYESFYQAEETGIVPMPQRTDRVLGGHAVWACGYNDYTGRVKCRNSWSKGWGDKGHFYMPYDYLTNTRIAQEFITIKLV